MKGNKVFKKIVVVSVVAAIGTSLFTGCGSKTSKSTDASNGSGNQAPRKISIMLQTFGENPPEDNFILKTIEEKTNTTLDLMWVPSTSYKDKTNIVIASGELPNVMLIADPKLGSFITAAQQGAFWEVGPHLKDYPIYLSKMDQTRLKNSQINGKNYGLFRYRPVGRSGYVVRKDWLDNLGLSVPTTTDEFYNMLKEFTYNDPDKNGKNDTIGGVTEKGHSFGHLIAPFGASNTWYIDSNGKVKVSAEQKEYVEGMKFVRKLYQEKLINQDFLVASDSGALFKKGNAGVRMGGTVDDMAVNWTEITQVIPNASFDGIPKLKGPGGARTFASSDGTGGWFVFPKSSNKTEADLKANLSFFDKLSDPKAVGNTIIWGKEGTDFTLNGDTASRTAEQSSQYLKDSYSLTQLSLSPEKVLDGYYVNNDTKTKRANELIAFNEKDKDGLIYDPTAAYTSQTWNERKSDLQKILNDARGKFIIGALDEEGFMKEVQKFYTSGGQQVCDELTKLMENSKK